MVEQTIIDRTVFLTEVRALKSQGLELTIEYDGEHDSGSINVFKGEEQLDYNDPISRFIEEKMDNYLNFNGGGRYCGENGTVTIDLEKEAFVKEGFTRWEDPREATRLMDSSQEIVQLLEQAVDDLTWANGDWSISYKKDAVISEETVERFEQFKKQVDQTIADWEIADWQDDWLDVWITSHEGKVVLTARYQVPTLQEEKETIPF